MQIAKSTDYALRVLIYAFSKQRELVTQQEIADFFDISREHLRKIVHELAKAGFLVTRRGKNGGIALARHASEINVAEVVMLLETKAALIDCDGMACVLSSNCRLRSVFNEADRSFMQTLAKYSLADIVNDSTQRLIFA